MKHAKSLALALCLTFPAMTAFAGGEEQRAAATARRAEVTSKIEAHKAEIEARRAEARKMAEARKAEAEARRAERAANKTKGKPDDTMTLALVEEKVKEPKGEKVDKETRRAEKAAEKEARKADKGDKGGGKKV